MANTRMEVLRLYKIMLRESQRFNSYNFRHYAIRRIRDAFKENKNLQDAEKISQQLDRGRNNLEMIKRQVVIGRLYQTEKLIIEQ